MTWSAMVNNAEVAPEQLQVPTMNFGQMKRWIGHEKMRYKIEITLDTLEACVKPIFEKFRAEEIADNDTEDFPELEAFKQAGWPSYQDLIQKDPQLLSQLMIFNDYDVIEAIIHHDTKENVLYSINSLDDIKFGTQVAILEGICFKVKRRT